MMCESLLYIEDLNKKRVVDRQRVLRNNKLKETLYIHKSES